ncbi:P-loop containing nucleoside triphosphate hydrolase protein [Xylaria nigripes]|nr:P-loop containing nucleoside triphosphate hydrolase protein [Xylaria nigripes]
MSLLPHRQWLLLSDIHFRLRDQKRARQTADWIVSVARGTPGISRVVICGDVLTSRSTQPTAVISAAYNFLSDLSSSVPHVNVILGNHDLAYRRDYGTTALEALKMSRLRPFVTLHDEVGKYNWDGRDVLVLPFREDQTELTTAVAHLDPIEAARTISFAHLALNRAVTQRHVVRDDGSDAGHSIRYKGLTGPDYFSALARTFTGHFHSHQTILQPNQRALPESCEDRLNGSVTYIGSPLQLTWADLQDEDRGVILLNPATLKHELKVNPHAVGYITVEGSDVLADNIDISRLQGKNVMILGKLTQFQYWTARERLLSLGAQSVRESRATATLRDGIYSFPYNSLGASVPGSDRDAALISPESSTSAENIPSAVDEKASESEPDGLESVRIDPVECVRDYVQSSGIEPIHEEELIKLGQRLILASDDGENIDYMELLDSEFSITARDDFWAPTKQVFVAKPVSIVISNFLGIQEECTLDFKGDRGRGLTFVVGRNGSGKSTIIEAIVWCQFGKCIRKGLSVGEVVNDVTGRDCMVSLAFANGYTITRYRKHKVHGNRVIVSLHGQEQPQLEHGEARATQAALDELLGIDYEEFIKTVVLGHESTTGFLSATPAQRQDLIESTLRLSGLDQCANVSRKMLRDIDDDITALRVKIDTVEQAMSVIRDRIANKTKELQRFRIEEEKVREEISAIRTGSGQGQVNSHAFEKELTALSKRLDENKLMIEKGKQEVDAAQSVVNEVHIRDDVAALQSVANWGIEAVKGQIQALQNELESFKQTQRVPETMEPIRKFERATRCLAEIISWLREYTMKSMGNRSSPSWTRPFIGIGLFSLEKLLARFNSLLVHFKSSIFRQEKEYADVTEKKIGRIQTQIAEGKSKITKLTRDRDEAHAKVALDKGLGEQYVRSLCDRLSGISVQDAGRRLSSSVMHLSKLLEEQDVLHRRQAKVQHEIDYLNNIEAMRSSVAFEKLAKKEQEMATYQKLIKEEHFTLDKTKSSHGVLKVEIENLISQRERFAFWEEALSRRRTKSATASTFRGYILDKSLQELNNVATRILLVLYENTPHARELTKGMLRTIVAPDADYDQDSDSSQVTLLDQTLGVTKTLSYAKRSGGERKRIDLAIFFALVQIAQAHSPHRARYILVDEAFDSLDASGQAAVVRLCSQLMPWTDFQLVVTHSEYLAGSAQGSSGDEDSNDAESQFSVLSATMTKEGTKFSYNMA